MPVTDELLANNAAYARYFTSADLPMPPGKMTGRGPEGPGESDGPDQRAAGSGSGRPDSRAV